MVIFFMFMLLIPSFKLMGRGYANPQPPRIHLGFNRIPNSENYTGGILSLDINIEVERIRIALYDDNLHLKETGLLSDYSKNTIKKYYLDFWDANNNNRLDCVDIFYLFGKGEVQPNWGVVLTYEPTGDIIASNTISGNVFTLEEEKKEDYGLITIFLVTEFIIFGMIILIVFYYLRK